MKTFLAFTAMLVLTGCVAPRAMSDFSFAADDHQGKGLLVGSLVVDDPGNTFSQDIYVYFDPVDPNSKLPRVQVHVNNHCHEGSLDIDFTKPCGQLFAFVLPAGDYQLDEWHIAVGGPIFDPETWHGVKVSIQAGKAAYVGEIHMVFDDKLLGPGPTGWRAWPHGSDQHERDFPVLFQRLPKLGPSDVVTQLLDLPPPGRLCMITGGGYPVSMPTRKDCSDHDPDDD